MSVTVALVDDEPAVRDTLIDTLSAGGLAVVGHATAEGAIELVLMVRPDVAVIDLEPAGSSGVQTIQQLGLLAPACRVLVLAHGEQPQLVEAVVAGATGHVLRTAPPQAMIAAIRATAAGEPVLSPQIVGKLLERIRELQIPVANSHTAAAAIRAALTTRELEIFTLLAGGESNQQIGNRLSLSTNTVANHIKSILAKLHLENRIQAAAHAIRSGIA